MSLHQQWLEAPYQAEAKAAELWESFCDFYEDDLRAELQSEPDDYMRESVAERLSDNLHLWKTDINSLLVLLHDKFESSLDAAVKRALEAKWRDLP